MAKKSDGGVSIGMVWKSAWNMIIHRPVVLVPFAVVSVVEGLALTVLHLAPRPPVSAVLAPPIRAFFGEVYLHYPMDLALLPRLFGPTQAAITLLLGSFCAGVLAMLVQRAAKGEEGRPDWAQIFRSLLPYAVFFILINGAAYFSIKYLMAG